MKDGCFVHKSTVLNEDERRLQEESALRLIWWGLRRKGGSVVARGEDENFTDTKLDDIRVIATFAASFVDALLYENFTKLRCDPLDGTGRCNSLVEEPFNERMQEVRLEIVRLAGDAEVDLKAKRLLSMRTSR